jgi:hypothetical protein
LLPPTTLRATVEVFDSASKGGGPPPHGSLPFITARRPAYKTPFRKLIVLSCRVGCHGNLVFNNLLPGNDSFAAILCNGNLISEPLLNNGHLVPAPVFRLSAVTSQCVKGRKAAFVTI